jgi:hypothetical protein
MCLRLPVLDGQNPRSALIYDRRTAAFFYRRINSPVAPKFADGKFPVRVEIMF